MNAPARPVRSVLIAGIAALAGLALCVSLGIWQVQRLEWKQGLQTAIEERARGPAVAAALLHDSAARGEDIEYTRVRVRGVFDHARELRFYAPGVEGPGWNLVTPLLAPDGAVYFVNRGYVPQARMGEADRSGEEVEITGLARTYGRRGAFTPDNDTAANVWYWYDLAAMRAHLDEAGGGQGATSLIAVVIEAEAAGEAYPRGGVTRLDLPNRHLEYALTWFGLALTLAAVYGVWAWQQLRRV